MKFEIVLCLLVALASCDAVGNSQRARVEGDCSPEDIPAEYLNECILLNCTKSHGNLLFVHQRCPDLCFDLDDPHRFQSGDLNKPYPDCCLKASQIRASARKIACT